MSEPLNEKELLTVRIFNRMVNELCRIKGVEFLTPAEYMKFKERAMADIAQEIENYIAAILA